MSAKSRDNIHRIESTYPWDVGKRIAASIALIAFLFIVIAGPATNPISSADLTAPIGRAMRPVHQSLYLGHGYRFFAPDPGPSHIVMYEIGMPGDETIVGQFPDAKKQWPRLLYHRWFMLSETLFAESQLPDRGPFEEAQKLVELEIAALKQAGKRKLARQLEFAKSREVNAFAQGQKRVAELSNSIGQHLLREHGGDWIKLSVHQRGIPYPKQISLGAKLDDPAQISAAVKSWVIEAPKKGAANE